ncbi:hypothetical protein SLS63_008788 [Diaporthe eres]|uniref:GH16 domain-containing protein n=1 Tax=Diaporthe eres TaxID=83184 RepID=A0ABR1P1I7_DIAER
MGYSKVLALLAAAGLPLTQAAVPTIDGFTLTWSDDFVGTANSLPNTANWLFSTGTSYPGGASNWGTGEIQTYTSSTENLALTGNGTLGITARKDASGAWTSARVETQRTDFACAAGGKLRIVGSLSLPPLGENGIGYWPAFWALGGQFRGKYQNWPQVGELDIMENVNAVNKLYGTLHCGVTPGGPCDENNGISGNTVPPTPMQGNFLQYTVEVDRTDSSAEAIRWYLGDTLYHQVTAAQVGDATVWADAVHGSYFVLLNLAIGHVVRIAPNDISFDNVEAWKEIYGHTSGGRRTFPKAAIFYDNGDLSFGESFGAVAGAKQHPWVSTLTESVFAASMGAMSRRIPILKLAFPFILPKELPQLLARYNELTREKTLKRVKMAGEVYRPDFFQQILSKGGDQVHFEELIQQASSLIIAGSETTATFLTSVTFHLLKNRPYLDELTREVRTAFQTAEDINAARCSELKYLNAVIEEGLRIWPPLSFGQLRESPGAVVSGVYLPPGTVCSVDMWSVHHNPKYWKDPDSFRPERWLGDGFGDNKDAFNPFILGPRACLGINLAYLEMRVILALLVFTYDWEMANPDLDFWKDARTTLFWVKPAVMVRFHPRKV